MTSPAEGDLDTSDIRARLFVAMATADYDGGWEPLGKVRDEVDVVRGWLCDERLGERRLRPALPELADNPARDDVLAAFTGLPQTWTEADAVAILIAGHGEAKNNRHFLILKDSSKDSLPTSALSTADLLESLADSRVEHLLLIIDACHAGLIKRQLDDWDDELRRNWVILPSAMKNQTAELGALSSAITQFLQDLGSTAGIKYSTGAYLSVNDFTGFINERLGISQRIVPIGTPDNWNQQHICLPNPHHVARRELALPRRDLEQHWSPRGRGLQDADESGWLFTDRVDLMHALIGRLTDPPGATVVTGAAGSGKSAALARLVTLSDPQFRERYRTQVATIPPDLLPSDGAVDIAVLATGKLRTEILAQILRASGIPTPKDDAIEMSVQQRLDRWHEWLRSRSGPHRRAITIVVDAVDEAASPTTLLHLLSLLDPDPNERRIRLIVGVRSPGGDGDPVTEQASDRRTLEELAEEKLAAVAIRVDRPPLWNQRDVVDYVGRILHDTAGSPYRGADVSVLGSAIGTWAGRSFLLARHAATWLAHGDTVLTADDPAVRSMLGEGLIGVVRANLRRHFGEDPVGRHTAVTLLRAVAFARGRGLPWHKIWPRLATVLDEGEGDRDYGDQDILKLLQSGVAGYLVTDRDADAPTYRPFHDELRDALRLRWRRLLIDPEPVDPRPIDPEPQDGATVGDAEIRAVEARIVRVLWQLAEPALEPGSRLTVEPYIRRHLAAHAAAAGLLDEAHLPAQFLPYADPWRLRVAAANAGGTAAQALPLLPVVRQVTHLWKWDDPARNAAAIQLWAALHGITGTPAGVSPWEVIWAVGPDDQGVVLGRHRTDVWAAATVDLPGHGAVAVTGSASVPTVWHLEDLGAGAEAVPLRGPGHDGTVDALAITRLRDGRNIVVTGGDDGTVRMWDLGSGEPVGLPFDGHERKVVAVDTAVLRDGSVVAVTGSADETLRVWNLDTGTPVGEALLGHTGIVTAVATAVLPGGTVVAVSGSADETVRVWNLDTGTPVGEPLLGHTGIVAAVATATLPGGRVVAVTGVRDAEARVKDRTLRRWDLGPHPEHVVLSTESAGVLSVTTAALADGRVVAVTGCEDATVRVTDLVTGAAVGEPLRGHSGTVTAVGTATPVSGQLIISGGNDTTVRAWDLDNLPVHRPREHGIDTVQAVTATVLAGVGPVALTSNADNAVQIWDLSTGTPVGPILTGAAACVQAITVGALPDGRTVVIAGIWDATVLIWDLATGTLLHPPLRGHRGPVDALHLTTLPDSNAVLVTGGWDAVRIWDPLTGAQHGPALDEDPTCVATATLADGSAAMAVGHLDGTVTGWDLGTQRRLTVPIPAMSEAATAMTTTVLPDRRTVLVVGDAGGTVRATDLATGDPIGLAIRGHPGGITALATAGLDGGRTAVVTSDPEPAIRCWDLLTGEELGASLPVPQTVRALAVYSGSPPVVLLGGSGLAAARMLHRYG